MISYIYVIRSFRRIQSGAHVVDSDGSLGVQLRVTSEVFVTHVALSEFLILGQFVHVRVLYIQTVNLGFHTDLHIVYAHLTRKFE